MSKKLIVVAIIVALLIGAFSLPNVIFAQSGTFEEAVSNFNNAKQSLQTETETFKSKIQTIKTLSEEIRNTIKEMKANGKEIPENAKSDLRKLRRAQFEIRRSMLIRNARGEYAGKILAQMKSLRKEIEEKRKGGASEEELKPLREKLRKLFTDLRLVAPLSPERMLKNSDKIMKKAESLNKNGKEKEAIRLLDKTTKSYEAATKALKEKEKKADNLIDLLNKIKGELGE